MAATAGSVPSTSCRRCHGEIPTPATYCPHCGARQDERVAPGPALPGYTIVRPLGAGGAADVYLARQDDLDREVAIKVLRRDVDDPKQWRRFRREAQAIARLSSHPHVVTVHTAGRADTGQPFLVTEYLDRGSLSDVVAAEGPLSQARAARVGVAVADALMAAHGLGILHRDVKPGNVLLGRDGRVKLGDFGIARLLEAQSMTVTDVIAFTPEHVAPEVLRNEPDGPESDVYGLASTVAGALLGRSLFRMGPQERVDAFLARKVTSPPPPLPAWVAPVLARPIEAALDPDPRRRPSLPELRRDLAAAAEQLSGATFAPPSVAATAAVPATGRLPAPDGAGAEDGLRPAPLADRGDREAVDDDRRARRRLVAVLALALLALGALAAVAVGLFAGTDPEGAIPTTSAAPAPTVAPTTAAPTTIAPAPAAPAATVAPTTVAPTTVAPTTVAPTTVAPAPAAEAAAAAVPPSTVVPSSTNPRPTAPRPTNAPALLTSSQAETYLRNYYDAVETGDYERSWAQLAPEFQTGMARSFDYYVGFWDGNDIEVGDVELVRADAEQAVVDAELRWNGSSEPVISRFTLRPDADGTLLIADQESVDD